MLTLIIALFFFFPSNVAASSIAEQTKAWDTQINVWKMSQDLGSNLSGQVSKFTFRTLTSSRFDYTVNNTKIYDKTNNYSFIRGCGLGINPEDGIFKTINNIPSGYQDVTIDFSCRNYQFIPNHNYFIVIGNANFCQACIKFSGHAVSDNNDYFQAGGLLYTYDNQDCFYPIENYQSRCHILVTPKDDLYFKLEDTSQDDEELPVDEGAPQPFLDLPWDYQNKGLDFNDAALSINSFFDHEYPLLSGGLGESGETISGTLINFLGGGEQKLAYSSHDGYDYGRPAKVHIGDPILAAAAGTASFVNSCAACGNMIVIDHHNGYQTRYLHLQKDGLITNVPGEKIEVSARQQIGRVGATGNVFPSGDTGAHIHFGVFQDKNGDGSFEDNVPDGVTDPFGWQSTEPDPWANYSFIYSGQQRWGNKSYYLWTNKLANLDSNLPSNGGVFKVGNYTFNFPSGVTNQNLKLNLTSFSSVKSNNLVSLGPTILALAKDSLNNTVTQFQKAFEIVIDFAKADLERTKNDTISFYSSIDGLIWTKEPTVVDLNNKTATTSVTHFTYFALMAERVDTTPPTTAAILEGLQGQAGWFRSDVAVNLIAQDNEDGLGVDYTIYKIDGGDFEQYKDKLIFSNEGHHKIEFYSADKDENLEGIKTIEFEIDKTLPRVSVDTDPKYLWSPDGKMVDIKINGYSQDANLKATNITVEDEYKLINPEILKFGQMIQLEASREGSDKDGRMYIIKAEAEDLAGNQQTAIIQIVVGHDQGQDK